MTITDATQTPPPPAVSTGTTPAEKPKEQSISSLLYGLVTALFERVKAFDPKATYQAVVDYPYKKSFDAKVEEVKNYDYVEGAKSGVITVAKHTPGAIATVFKGTAFVLTTGAAGFQHAASWLEGSKSV